MELCNEYHENYGFMDIAEYVQDLRKSNDGGWTFLVDMKHQFVIARIRQRAPVAFVYKKERHILRQYTLSSYTTSREQHRFILIPK